MKKRKEQISLFSLPEKNSSPEQNGSGEMKTKAHGKYSLKLITNRFLAVSMALSMAASGSFMISAEDYSDEEAWYKKCTQVQTSQEGVTACQGFQEYQKQKKESLTQSINDFNASISQISAETDEIESLALEQKELRESLEAQIAAQESAIADVTANIASTQEQIVARQNEIDAWDAQIKARMQSEQASTGTNTLIDLIMGAKNLTDMIRRISGLERITESDQDQIAELNRMKEELEFTKSELERLNQEQLDQLAQLEESKQQAQDLEASYNALIEEYHHKISELEAAKRSAQEDLDAVKEFSITAELSSGIDYAAIPGASGFINPVPSGTRSAGTWAYPAGGLHLGLDLAAPVGSPLLAPANGVIVYASNTQPSTGGYLGNWSGSPSGSGNAITMLAEVNGTLYGISFYHLSNEFYVTPGTTVSQGQTIALTGHSGNSTGPHTHVEVYNLGNTSMQDAIAQFQKTGDTTFGAGWGSTATACEYKGSTPCRERPETLF